MCGRVVCYRPALGSGVLHTEDGNELPFSTTTGASDLQGGDLVTFDPDMLGAKPSATHIRVIKPWVDELNEHYRPLVNEFHAVVRIVAAPLPSS